MKTEINAFFTREKANKGLPMPLKFPDGTDSGKTLHVLGVDSDTFRAASARKSRRLLEVSAELESKKDANTTERLEEEMEKANVELLASVVTGWDLDTPFTPENVRKLLTESRTVMQQVDLFAGDRASFFGKR
jgi:hypothetical protein